MYTKWREQTIYDLARAGISYPYAARLLRDASGLQRRSEIYCSIEISERETARLERKDAAAEKRVRAIAEQFGATVEFQGDPRGCPFALVKDGRTIHVVGRGLPARCFR